MTRRSWRRPFSVSGRTDAEDTNRRRRLGPLLPLVVVVVLLGACAPGTAAPNASTLAWTARLPSSPAALRADFFREAKLAGWEREPTGEDASGRVATRVERCGWLGIGTYDETLRSEISFVPLDGGGTLVALTLDPAPEAVAFGAAVRGALGGTWTASVDPRGAANPTRVAGRPVPP